MSSTEPVLQKVRVCNWFHCSETFSVLKADEYLTIYNCEDQNLYVASS